MFSMTECGGRRFIVVDMENIVGGGVLSVEAGEWVRKEIVAVIGERVGDQVVVGTARNGCLNAGLAWTGARRVMRDGASGADLALLEVLGEDIEARFAEVIVISGDHIFSERVSEIAGSGLKVTVVGVRRRTSIALRIAAHETKYIPMTYNEAMAKDAA